MKNFDYYINEDSYNDLDNEKCYSDLSNAIKCKTISKINQDEMDFNEFHKLQEYLKKSFPIVTSLSDVEIINKGSMIWHIKGNKDLKEVLFMAHLDVVSIVEGTIDDWDYDPFSGKVTEEFIYGRGSEDIKCMVIAYLEALEYLFSKGYKNKHGIYLCFGHDEETLGGKGQEKIRDTLKSRQVQLEFVLDEGGSIEDGKVFAIDNPLATINIMEKGYADLEVKASSIGGHSSNASSNTSLGRVGKAISLLEDYGFKPYLNNLTISMFSTIAKYTSNLELKKFNKDDKNTYQDFIEYLSNNDEFRKYVVTTTASTMLRGASESPNVLPRDVWANVNYRLLDNVSCNDILVNAKQIMIDNNVNVNVKLGNHTNASKISKTDSYDYKLICNTINKFYKNVVTIPSMICGGTDCFFYNDLCDNCYRFVPIFNDLEKCGNEHNTNERCQKKAFIHGIKFMIDMMKEL